MSTRRALWMLIGVLSFMITVMVGTLGTLMMFYGQGVSQQLLVLDESSRLRLVGMDGMERILVDDASNDLLRYPATAPDGRHVAYISRDDSGVALNRLNLVSGKLTELYRSAENPPLYLSWSPDGRNISFLSNLRLVVARRWRRSNDGRSGRTRCAAWKVRDGLVAIVSAPGVTIRQHPVGCIDPLRPLARIILFLQRSVGITIRVITPYLLTIGALYFVERSGALYTE